MDKDNFDYTQGFVRGYPLVSPFDFKDKERAIGNYIGYMLIRTQSMFEYENLPDSIPQRVLEFYLQTNGNVCIAEVDGELYCFTGGLGGEPDAYYMPTIYTVANPYLRLSKTYNIGEDCVVIPSDSLYTGLIPLFRRYATQLVENDLSMNIVDIMSRVVSLFSASDDKTKQSAEKYIHDIVAGDLGVVGESAFLDGIRSQPVSSSSYNAMTPLIEYHQYLKASWLNDIGLNANFNMKRESLNSSESALNQDSLLPLIDDMLKCRRKGVEAVNKMFGTNISVKLASSWEDNAQEIEAEQQALIQEYDEDVEQQHNGDVSQVEPEEQLTETPVDVLENIVDKLEDVVEEIRSGEEDDPVDTDEEERLDET